MFDQPKGWKITYVQGTNMGKLLLKLYDKTIVGFHAVFSSNPGAAARLAKRLGSKDGSISKILQSARNNPVTATFVALEAGEAGFELLDALRTEYPEMVSQLESINYQHDDVAPDTQLSDLEIYKDELAMIDDLSAQMGGDRNMFNLINVVRMCMENKDLLTLRERVLALTSRY